MPIINVKIPLEKKIYSVSELNKQSRTMLERQFNCIQIEGELTNLAKPRSGHIYFRLKDPLSQIQCAFFKNKAMLLNVKLEEGMQVIVTATVSLYEARGDYQLIVDSLQLAGQGQLQLRFEALKKKLQTQGFFDSAHKKNLPKLPKQIGIITSPSGAALHDILSTLKRRFPAIPVCIYPTQVQGASAANQIAQQIKLANEHKQCEVLILARGGGSLEDLWPFNEEVVAHAIFHSQLPIVSGVGHEVDITLADFCADHRAATPTAAAETVTPNIQDVLAYLTNTQNQLQKYMYLLLNKQQNHLTYLKQRLKNPENLLHQKTLHIEALNTRLIHTMHQLLTRSQHKTQQLTQRLLKLNPIDLLHQKKNKLNILEQRLHKEIHEQLQHYKQRFTKLCATLQATSPLATIDRGYSLALDEKKQLITSSKQMALEQTFWLHLKEGKLQAKVIKKDSNT